MHDEDKSGAASAAAKHCGIDQTKNKNNKSKDKKKDDTDGETGGKGMWILDGASGRFYSSSSIIQYTSVLVPHFVLYRAVHIAHS